ncbi:Isochorismatase [Phenylobacterium sp. Root77]|uniref:cysteine hydrolase family protein n=1 Tax=unclassified Phenylobacterium TaxID=2640670 RepID=UPI0006F3658D|nr:MULTISPECIES: cysteine hydrolase family protein [unclassified Phenylobacterium]KQW65547.1 Isochorismatase [Phenylobacterium sp. Root1277]KQW94232.1 Isochorismatase [Phenylobacterium sp. Root1290]KRC38966.1 Isochorismatase [Phenylobacterium sp. Root77]
MSKRVVVVVDLQNEYLSSGKLPLTGIDQAVQSAAKVIAAARASGDQVVHIRHEMPVANAPVFTPGSDGVQIIAGVAPAPGEQVIVKNYPNAFRETDLEAVLKAQDAQEVVIVGAMSHMCVAATSRAASDLGYKTTVVHDACATMDLEFNGQVVPAAQVHAANMAAIAFAHGAVVSAAEVVG